MSMLLNKLKYVCLLCIFLLFFGFFELTFQKQGLAFQNRKEEAKLQGVSLEEELVLNSFLNWIKNQFLIPISEAKATPIFLIKKACQNKDYEKVNLLFSKYFKNTDFEKFKNLKDLSFFTCLLASFQKARKRKEILNLLKTLIHFFPHNSDLYYQLGVYYYRENSFSLARYYIKKSLYLQKKEEYYLFLVGLLIKSKRIKEAEALLKEISQHFPQPSCWYFYYKAIVSLYNKDLDDAQENFSKFAIMASEKDLNHLPPWQKKYILDLTK